MPSCSRFVSILTVIFLALSLTSFAAAKPAASPIQMRIDSLKALGEEYQGDLWHIAEAEMIQRRAQTAAALDNFSQFRDGGNGPANATVISTSGYQDNGSTLGKTNSASLPSCLSGGSDDAPDAWYVVTLAEPALLTVWTTCASAYPATYDTRIGIFDSSLALVDCNDDDPACAPNLQSRIDEKSLNAGTYYIVVDGYGGNSGGYQLNVSWSAQPAGCTNGSGRANAEIINALPFSEQGTTVGSCDDIIVGCELSGPDNAADYWYKVSIDTTTLLNVWTTCGPAWFDSKLAILDANLAQLYCNDDLPTCGSKQSSITNAALYPGEYYIVVDGYHSLEGDYEINVDGMPFNAAAIDTLYPDIIIKQDDLYDNQISTNIIPGHRHLKVTVTTPNIGDGKLYLYGVLPSNGDGTQDIRQRVYRSDGSFFDRLAGKFVFHPSHDHIHVEGWTQFRLRTMNPDSSVGPIVASGAKTSFCVLDLGVYDSSLPNFDSDGQFHSCSGTIQGLSVGWADTYTKDLDGQNIDITGLPDGVYWLEAEVDPLLRIAEKRENNNIARILVVIGAPNSANSDDYEPDDTFDAIDARPVGAVNSPNLGPCNPQLVIDSLSIHDVGNDDYYKFYCNSTGNPSDYVRIDFQHSVGDLDMTLYNASRIQVGTSTSTTNVESISLNGKPEGWYYLRVYGFNGAVSPTYKMTINPPANSAPAVTVVNPPVGDSLMVHGVNTYQVAWTYNDPESDECWVSVYFNSVPMLNGNQQLLPTSLNTQAAQGFFVINSAYVPEDTSLYIYCKITDGGTTTGSWSSGTVTFLHHDHAHGSIAGSVINSDSLPIPNAVVYLNNHEIEDTTIATGLFLLPDVEPGFYSLTVHHPGYIDSTLTNVMVNVGGMKNKVIMLSGCGFVGGDSDGDLVVSISDAVFVINYIFASGAAPSPYEAADSNCDGVVNISDAVYLINFIFAGGAQPCSGC